jgi:hypothetical protein
MLWRVGSDIFGTVDRVGLLTAFQVLESLLFCKSLEILEKHHEPSYLKSDGRLPNESRLFFRYTIEIAAETDPLKSEICF